MSTKLEERMVAYVESAYDEERGGYPSYSLNIKTLNGPLLVKFWNMANRGSFPSAGDFVELRVKDIKEAEAELGTYHSLSLDSTGKKRYYCELSILNEEDVPEDVKNKIRKDRNLQRSQAKELLGDHSFWNDRNVHDFLLSFVKENSERFGTVPAALKHHHAYKGGLFIHSCEVFCNCVALAGSQMNRFYDPINTDALYLAAWLHDAGKMEIYRMEGDQPKMDSDRENRIGHPTISDRMFLKASAGRGFSDDFIDAVSHCILSHHDRPKWGAVVKPYTKEAHFLCKADYLSSRNKD